MNIPKELLDELSAAKAHLEAVRDRLDDCAAEHQRIGGEMREARTRYEKAMEAVAEAA